MVDKAVQNLFEAIEKNDIELLYNCIEKDDLNANNDKGQTALDVALEKKRFVMHKILTLYGARHSYESLYDKDFRDFTPTEKSEYLKGAFAAYTEYLHIMHVDEIMELDLSKMDEEFPHKIMNIQEEIFNSKGFHFLHFAATFDDAVSLIFLLDNGFDYDLLDADGNTLLDYAKESNSLRAIAVLESQFGARTKEEICKECEDYSDEDIHP